MASLQLSTGVMIALRRSARARRLTLRVPRDGGPPVLTLPLRADLEGARAFAETRADWIARHVADRPPVLAADWGAALPIAGVPRRLVPGPALALSDDALQLPAGRAPGTQAAAVLRIHAAEALRAACDRHAAALGRPWRALVLRDPRARWGSCSADGRLMFSWRLAMAPPAVLDYVAAHEVAHLAHLDHSARFWANVAALDPHWREARDWLRGPGGAGLMRWRFAAEAGPAR